MGVRVESVPESVRLRISGDVETVIAVPYEDDGRFAPDLARAKAACWSVLSWMLGR